MFLPLNAMCAQGVVTVQRQFRERFPDRTIQENVSKYHHCRTSLNRNSGNSGENIAQVRNLLQNGPRNVSARRNGLGISPPSFNRITREELRWHPYRIIVRHALKQADYQRRLIGDEACFFRRSFSWSTLQEITHLISFLMRTAPVQKLLFGLVYVTESLWVHISLKKMLTDGAPAHKLVSVVGARWCRKFDSSLNFL